MYHPINIKRNLGNYKSEINWDGKSTSYVHITKINSAKENSEIFVSIELLREFMAEVKRMDKINYLEICSWKDIDK